MAQYKKDDNVKIKYTLLNGVVSGAAIDDVSFEVKYLVDFVDNDGVAQSRYFAESQLESNS